MYLLIIAVGAGALITGFMHVVHGPATAKMIGWPPGSPFQYEVGVADMAFGLIGVLCLFIRGNFWPMIEAGNVLPLSLIELYWIHARRLK